LMLIYLLSFQFVCAFFLQSLY